VVCDDYCVIFVLSGAERRDGRLGGHLLAGLGGVGDGPEAAAGQDVEAEVAAAFGPFVVLFGEDGADQSDEGVAVGEDADDVGAPADLAVEPLAGVEARRSAARPLWGRR
jgi:hypothetical protein